MKRIFIAADISDEARQWAASYIDGLRREFPKFRVGWERPEKLHLTLKFLGDVNEDRIEEVQQRVRDVSKAHKAFPMTLSGTGRFPPKGDPRILWFGANDGGELGAIASRIDRELGVLGFASEKRKFSPHLTIARLREPRSSSALAARHLENDFGPISFQITEIVIYESKLLPSGSIYTPIAVLPLGAN